MIKKILLSIGLFIVVVFILAITLVNKENLDFKSKCESVNADSIKIKIKNEEKAYVMIFSTLCPGKYETTQPLKTTIDSLKTLDIPFFIIADDLHNDSLDEDLDFFKKEFSFNDKIYILDANKYKINGGLFNSKTRYNSFLKELVGENHNIPLGYVVYLVIENGKLTKFYA